MALGAATDDKLYGVPEARRISDRATFATEDGSVGVTGRVTAAFDPLLSDIDVVYACGPMAMLAAVAAAGRRGRSPVVHRGRRGNGVRHRRLHDLRAAGAAAGRRRGAGIRMIRACTDGPVFPGDVVQFDLIGQPPPVAGSTVSPVPPVPDTFEAPI